MIFHTLIYILLFSTLFISLEIVKRKKLLLVDSTRRIAHVFSALIAFTFPYYLKIEYIVFLCILFLLKLTISKHKKILGSIHGVVRKTWGELFFPIGVGIVAILTLPLYVELYQISILLLGLADTAANIIGTYYPYHSLLIFRNKKTYSGSLAFAIVAVIIFIAFGINPVVAVVFGAVLSVIEVLSPYGTDNLTVPLFTAVLLKVFLI
jgi:phytol kinase